MAGGPVMLDISPQDTGTALFSEDRAYRYHLTRLWGDGGLLTWIMLNPSTAGATEDDPTIRRCIGFTRRDGWFGGLQVVNLFGLIATRPVHLTRAADPVGPLNRGWVDRALAASRYAVAAWGAAAEKVPTAQAEVGHALGRAIAHGVVLMDLGRTQKGHPRHPLYLRSDTPWSL